MDSENEKRPQKERAPKPPKEPRQKETRAKEPREARDKKEKEQRRRERPIEASEVFVAAEESSNDIFRKRLTYLMNGNNPQGKAVNIQELADAVGVSRPAIRKYLKPKGAPTTPSAATVCAIARYFGTTPDFLLGFDEPDTEAARKALESDYYNALGLNQRTIDLLRALRERQGDERASAGAAALMSMLDRQVAAFAEDALRLLEDRS
ncbi:MAG TPA: helix-turn-helix transcriptional regulator [Candidatus Scatomorpha intestinavium]|uniref:Helix-turn-helix transcriptional regulator n=1 Tax=Candidatus Scatomorpha intestinavium TaxID=2840922 RepID=A0A9D1CSN9_9FIRM|nr:helix-turn-helix transcriptional regulator [Candidatus Scatomorpha intestinavium]